MISGSPDNAFSYRLRKHQAQGYQELWLCAHLLASTQEARRTEALPRVDSQPAGESSGCLLARKRSPLPEANAAPSRISDLDRPTAGISVHRICRRLVPTNAYVTRVSGLFPGRNLHGGSRHNPFLAGLSSPVLFISMHRGRPPSIIPSLPAGDDIPQASKVLHREIVLLNACSVISTSLV